MSIHVLVTVYILIQISTNLSIKFLVTFRTFVYFFLAMYLLVAVRLIFRSKSFVTLVTRKRLFSRMMGLNVALQVAWPRKRFATFITAKCWFLRGWLLPIIPFRQNLLLSFGWPRKYVHWTKLAIDLIIFQLCHEFISPENYTHKKIPVGLP